jgi:predicted membrane protein
LQKIALIILSVFVLASCGAIFITTFPLFLLIRLVLINIAPHEAKTNTLRIISAIFFRPNTSDKGPNINCPSVYSF